MLNPSLNGPAKMKPVLQARLAIVIILVAFLSAPSSAWSREYQLAQTFKRSSPQNGDLFGTGVAIDGDIIAIKSHSGYLDGDGISITNIFERDGSGDWRQTDEIIWDSGQHNGNFFMGQELAIDGDTIVNGYGLAFDSTSPSPLRLSTRTASGWETLPNKPVVFSPRDPDRFARDTVRTTGRHVDISGDIAVAAASATDRGGVGRVYGKSPDGYWREEANLIPADPSGSKRVQFSAASVAIENDTIVLADRIHSGIAALYFYDRMPNGAWVESQNFYLSNRSNSEGQFPGLRGWPIVEIYGDTVVASDVFAGVLDIYERSGGQWQLVQEIHANTDVPFSIGGFDIDENLIAYAVAGGVDAPVEIEVARRNSEGVWAPFTTIRNPDPNGLPYFGSSIAISNGRILVGAHSFQDLSPDSPPGVAYLYVPVPEPATLVIVGMAGALLVLSRAGRWTRLT